MRRTLLAALSTVVGLVMLLSFKTHGSRPGRVAVLGARSGVASGAPSTAATPSPGTSGSPGVAASGGDSRTVLGDVAATPYGPVQLQVTFAGAQVVSINPVQLPSGRPRDDEINSYAVPILAQEALQAQSASIDVVSGATYTSEGYAQSLQSALDKAHA